jgi:hypothetical protein
MREITRAISIARRRILAVRVLRSTGQALVLALPIVLALLLIDRWTAFDVSILVYALIMLAALASGLWAALWRLPRAMEVCIEIDRRLHLKDRIGTAHAIANARGALLGAGFAPLVLANAQQLAPRLDLRSAIPIRVSAHWVVVGVLAVVLGLTAWLLPSRQPPRVPDGGDQGALAAAPAEVAAAREAIEKTTDDIRASLDEKDAAATAGDSSGSHTALEEQIEALDKIAQQLTRQDPANPATAKARSDASASMSELAEEMAARSERDLESLQELARRFQGLEPPEPAGGAEEMDRQLREFLDAMSQGEFERAAEALDEATSAAQSLDDEAKRSAAEQLRQLSEQIEKLAEEREPHKTAEDVEAQSAVDSQPKTEEEAGDPPPAQAQEESLRRALEDLGKSREEIDEMLEPDQQESSKRDTESELIDSGADEELAEKLARAVEEVRKERETDQRADEQTRKMSDAMRRTADSVENPEQQQGEPQTQRQQPSPDGQRRESTPQRESEQPRETPSPSDEAGEQQAEKREGESEQQQQPGSKPMPGSQQPPESSESAPTPGAEQAPGAEQIPGAGAGAQPDGESQEDAPSQSPVPDAPSMLRELERMRDAAESNRELSERVKERARELADTMSPEERRALERWAEAQQREQPPPEAGGSPQPERHEEPGDGGTRQADAGDGRGPGDKPGEPARADSRRLETDPTNADLARNDELGGTKIGELPGDDELLSDPETRATSTRRNLEAQRAAQRAVEQGEVPARYHRFIQRYFRQFAPEENRRRGAEDAEGKN